MTMMLSKFSGLVLVRFFRRLSGRALNLFSINDWEAGAAKTVIATSYRSLISGLLISWSSQ